MTANGAPRAEHHPSPKEQLQTAIRNMYASGMTADAIFRAFSESYIKIQGEIAFSGINGHGANSHGVNGHGINGHGINSNSSTTPGSGLVSSPAAVIAPPSIKGLNGTSPFDGMSPLNSKPTLNGISGVSSPKTKIPGEVVSITTELSQMFAEKLGLTKIEAIKTEATKVEAKIDPPVTGFSKAAATKAKKAAPKEKKGRKVVYMTEVGGVYCDEDWDEDAHIEGPPGYPPVEYN
ncbi:hypothetical protein VTI74DRAFT_4240 [Chaetomium olivicolor]